MEAEHWREADPADVVDVMAPEVERAREAGVYQEPSIPDWVRESTEAALVEWFVEELTAGVGDTAVRAAWIKVSTDDDPGGISSDEETVLRAAARAGTETGALVGSHTLYGDLVHRQLDVVESAGYSADRFVWIHAQAADLDDHREVAERGAYIEYDWIGGDDQDDADYLDLIEATVSAGHTDRLLLSQDRGWYDPSKPGGGDQRPYTYLPEEFLPKLRERLDDATVRRLTHDNPFEAYAR